MKNWGFGINKDKQVDYNAADLSWARSIALAEPSFDICIGCGTCTATCSAGAHTDFNLRRIMLLIKRGEKNLVIKDIEKCMFCGKCQLACPRGVNTRNILLEIKRLAN
jgi:heterodisulfide reductase subunit C